VITLKSVAVMTWARQRRLDRLRAELAQRKAETAAALARAHQARCTLDERVAASARGSAQLAELLCGSALRPEDVVMQGHVLGALQALQAQAQAHLANALECVQQASARQAATLRQVKRVELQLKELAGHRERLLREQDAQQQDLQDEESEEAAQARGLGQRRDLARQAHAQAAAAAKGAP
jgi:hypothetical protein